MRKFYICPNGIFKEYAQWWLNFKNGIDPDAWPDEVLEEKYNAVLVNSTSDHMHYVLFNTEKDATFFMLKWA